MLKKLREMRYEIFAVCLLLVLGALIAFLVKLRQDRTLSGVLCALVLIDGALLLFVLRKLWRTKWRKRVSEIFENTLGRAIISLLRFLERVLDRWNSGYRKRENILGGKTEITFEFGMEKKDKFVNKARRWKQMKSDRERLGYLYRKMIDRKLERGVNITRCETPTEIKAKHSENETENELFDMYIEYRYDNRKCLSTEKLIEIKNRM